MQSPLWPPAYTLRHSKRARNINLRVCPRKGLQVVVPKRFNMRDISPVLEKHRQWIERTLQRVKPCLPTEPERPTQIHFKALEETWQIEYQDEASSTLKMTVAEQKIILSGQIQNIKYVHQALQSFTQHRAKQMLIPWLQQLATQSALTHTRTGVRDASTLWGSCSHKKSISLNKRLLFLPKELVEYVMLHELCHTVHMNHSKRFWNLLAQFSPNCLVLRKALRQADQYLPAWIHV